MCQWNYFILVICFLVSTVGFLKVLTIRKIRSLVITFKWKEVETHPEMQQ